jgi:hypothetical protein
VREWARLYQTPLWLAAGFIVLLALFAVTPDPARSAADNGPEPTSEPTPGPGECVICGIDQECDPSSGRCVFIKATPLPCVESAKFDEKAGFCLPTGAPTPVPQPDPTDELPEELERQPRQPRSRFSDDPRFEDSRRDEEPTEEPIEEPTEEPED